MVKQMSSLCEYLIQNHTPSLNHPRGLTVRTNLCSNRAEEVHIFRYQPNHETGKQEKAIELHYYCHRHGKRRMWQISSAWNYGNPKITWACVPIDNTPLPMEFWDNSNISPVDFPLFAEMYRQTYGSVPIKQAL